MSSIESPVEKVIMPLSEILRDGIVLNDQGSPFPKKTAQKMALGLTPKAILVQMDQPWTADSAQGLTIVREKVRKKGPVRCGHKWGIRMWSHKVVGQVVQTVAATDVVNSTAGTKVDKILVGQPSFEVSIDLQENISSYASAVLLSSKITIYKGDGPKNVLLGIIKKYRFDIPDGVEKIPADWAKIVAEVQEALTQKYSKIKKLIGWSLEVNKTDETNGPDSEHQNIFTLAQT
ncbi:hypothetical protein B0H14DRAFT_2620315 [Mycena olivaceomarginata]|nr:hypothetical protein B0H14DRAFT_2620315 [Mycena olivaceomarginata]